MGVINTGSFAKALWPGINKFYGESYDEWTPEFTQLFEMVTSDKAFEEDVGTSGFGLANETSEGGSVSYDESRQAFVTRYVNKAYTHGFIVTQAAMEDNQYNIAALGKKDAQALAFAIRQTQETIGANVYNRAFDSNYLGGDGLEMCSKLHVNKAGGTWSNELAVAADLSEAALEQAFIDISKLKDDRGLQISVLPRCLVIPTELQFEATRILKSVGQADTANNALNALRQMGAFPEGIKINHYLTDVDAWFIRTNCKDSLKWFDRIKPTFAMDNDFDTYNAKFKARFRMSAGWTDPRGIFASPGA